MLPKKTCILNKLLNELADDPKGFIPNEIWNAVQKAFALSFIELAIVQRSPADTVQILLTHRADENCNGWHIPGGLWRTRSTLEENIISLASSELGKAKLTLLAKGGWEKWHDCQYGHPISHIVICSGTGIVENATRKWFSEVPKDMIDDNGHHTSFIKQALAQAETLI